MRCTTRREPSSRRAQPRERPPPGCARRPAPSLPLPSPLLIRRHLFSVLPLRLWLATAPGPDPARPRDALHSRIGHSARALSTGDAIDARRARYEVQLERFFRRHDGCDHLSGLYPSRSGKLLSRNCSSLEFAHLVGFCSPFLALYFSVSVDLHCVVFDRNEDPAASFGCARTSIFKVEQLNAMNSPFAVRTRAELELRLLARFKPTSPSQFARFEFAFFESFGRAREPVALQPVKCTAVVSCLVLVALNSPVLTLFRRPTSCPATVSSLAGPPDVVNLRFALRQPFVLGFVPSAALCICWM